MRHKKGDMVRFRGKRYPIPGDRNMTVGKLYKILDVSIITYSVVDDEGNTVGKYHDKWYDKAEKIDTLPEDLFKV